MTTWQPIETIPEGIPVLVWADRLHRGLASAEVVVAVRNGSAISYWTNGGPNAGSDIDFDPPPSLWAPLEPP